MSAAPQKIRTGLVELRTKLGPVYVNPSFWERVHLLWTFRNFRSLPKQVLNEREQRLIDNLCRTAVVRRAVPTTDTSIIGIVENVELIPVSNVETSAAPRKLVNMSVTDVDIMPSRAVGGISVPFKWVSRAGHVAEQFRSRDKVQSIAPRRSEEQKPSKSDSRLRLLAGEFGYWGGWAVIGLCSLAVVGIRSDLQKNQPAISKTAPILPAVHMANREALPINSGVIQPRVATIKKIQQASAQYTDTVKAVVAAANVPLPTKTGKNSSKTSVPPHFAKASKEIPSEQQRSHRIQIAEAPASWSYPVAPDSSLTGNVVLKAVVGKNGSVTEVDVVSGKQPLAQAAARAVKHWKYRTHEIDGAAVEAETNIAIRFLGDDAVSIRYSKAE